MSWQLHPNDAKKIFSKWYVKTLTSIWWQDNYIPMTSNIAELLS